MLFLINCSGIELVLCNLHFKRFDLTKGLLFDTFLITVWYKLCHCDHSVLKVRMIFTTNELVDRIRNFKSNASLFKKIFYEKYARRSNENSEARRQPIDPPPTTSRISLAIRDSHRQLGLLSPPLPLPDQKRVSSLLLIVH